MTQALIPPATAPALVAPATPGLGPGRAVQIVPGLALCGLVAAGALALQGLEVRLFGRAWLEALVLAIVLGATLRSLWTPPERLNPGIAFGAKFLLELAVVLLGAAVSGSALIAVGPALIAGIAATVVAAIGLSYGLGRLFGLPHRMAVLIACGNSICGNSAIAAVAPVIEADPDDVAAAIAFTAVLGVLVVLGLPLLAQPLGLSPRSFGVLAGLTVYAVPQVLAATAPVSSISAQVGTLVKLVRVLMLGPVCLGAALAHGRGEGAAPARRLQLHRLVPWFILGFLAMIAARSAGLIPVAWLAPLAGTASVLTIASMAALGLGVDARVVAGAGLRVASVVCLSLLALGAIALGLIRWVG